MTDHARFVAPARLIALLTAGSRVLGLVRECAYSYVFGVDPAFSFFRVAFMIPNLSRRLFGEGAMSSAFIPVFTEVLHQEGLNRARQTAGTALTALGAMLIGLTVLGELGLGIGLWTHESTTLRLTIIMLPYMVLICLTAFAGGMLNALHRFGAPAAAPIILNVVLLATLVGGATLGGLRGLDLLYLLAVAVLLAGLLQFGAQVLTLRRAGCSPAINFNWSDPYLRRVVLLMAPMVLGMSATQLNVLADSLIALFLVPLEQGPSVLGYAHMIFHLPLGVFGTAIATAVFPLLSAKATEGNPEGLARVFERGLRVTIFIALPATAGLMLLATPLVTVLYERGEFCSSATQHVANTLIFYAAGLVASSALQIAVRLFYALQNTRTPVRIGLAVLGLNVTLNLVLVLPFAEGGLALASTISATVQVAALSIVLRRHVPQIRWRLIAAGAGRTTVCVVIMSLVVWVTVHLFSTRSIGPFWQLAVSIPAGVIAFTAAARVLRCPELPDLLRRDPGHGMAGDSPTPTGGD